MIDLGNDIHGKKLHMLRITIQYDDLAPRQQNIKASGAALVALNTVIQSVISMAHGGDSGMSDEAYSGHCSRCGGTGCAWCEGTGKFPFFQEGEEV